MFIRLLATIVTFALALFFIHLGLEHMAGKVGITPYLAFLFAGISAIAPAIMYERIIGEIEDLNDILYDLNDTNSKLNESNNNIISLYKELTSNELLEGQAEVETGHPMECTCLDCNDYGDLERKHSFVHVPIKSTLEGRYCQDPPFTCMPPWCDHCNSKGEHNAEELKQSQAGTH